jgi:hypothetical protein
VYTVQNKSIYGYEAQSPYNGRKRVPVWTAVGIEKQNETGTNKKIKHKNLKQQ